MGYSPIQKTVFPEIWDSRCPDSSKLENIQFSCFTFCKATTTDFFPNRFSSENSTFRHVSIFFVCIQGWFSLTLLASSSLNSYSPVAWSVLHPSRWMHTVWSWNWKTSIFGCVGLGVFEQLEIWGDFSANWRSSFVTRVSRFGTEQMDFFPDDKRRKKVGSNGILIFKSLGFCYRKKDEGPWIFDQKLLLSIPISTPWF